jgi:hypothetical protein
MAQHDYSIANATGLNFRTDLNAALSAIVSQNSGSTGPAPAFPGMLWLDLSGGGDGVMRRRNQANNAWLTDIGVDQAARNAAAAAQAKADRALLRDATATVAERTMALALVLPNTVPTGHEAVSRTQADLLYQVKLPTPAAGSLLVGTAGGWAATLPPGADGGLVVQSGGVPIWQNPATVAAPNAIVKTKVDGTIDPSFIPSVASGLKYCGTFKPVVNDEYPAAGDNGHGAGGAPAIGDFWVIDGLTTGGYTYLTGSLAGVTVYNGDSVAYDGAKWFRMGSTVEVQGYLKLDGSTAMAGNLDLGAHPIVKVAGITGRPGPQVPLANFFIDQTSILISPQRGTTGADLSAMATGQIGTDLGRMQLFVGAGGANTPLIGVRNFSETAAYAMGSYVVNPALGYQYRAPATISAGAFVAAQWRRVIDQDGGTFLGMVTIDLASRQLMLKNGAFQRGLEVDSNGVTNLSDINNSTYAWQYVPDGVGNTNFRGSIAPSSHVIAGGTVYAQSGFFQGAGHVVINANASGGIIYLRPNGANEQAGQTIVRSGGELEVAGPVYCSNLYASGGSVEGANGYFSIAPRATGGIIYLRPNGWANTSKMAVLQPTGDCSFAGIVSALNIPASDQRLKEHVANVATRDLAALPFKSFNFIGQEASQRGPLAQDVLALAPEYVIAYDCIDPCADPEAIDAGAPPMVTRYTLNYGGLAIEMALNALQRVAALEDVAAASVPSTRSKTP